MKANERKGAAISDIRIIFYPKSIIFNHAKDTSYRLYLEKNVQVINEVPEIIKIRPKFTTFTFSKDGSAKPFRVTNEKFCSYQISLYQVQPNGEEVLKDSAEFTLNKFIRGYFEQYQKLDEQVKGKEKSAIAEHWRALSNNFTRKAYTNTVKFKQVDAIFQFVCIPETDYDQLVREDDIRRQKKRQYEERNKRPGQFTKSKTLPALKLDSRLSGSSKKYHENDSDIGKLNYNAGLDQQTKKEMTQSLKKFSLKLPDAHKSPRETETSSSNQASNGLPTKSKINATDRESLLARQILIAEQTDEEQNPNASPADGNQEILTSQGKVPVIQIKNIHSYENPQIYNISARLGTLSLNSVMNTSSKSEKKIETKSNTKQTLLTSAWILLNSFLMVYLMHPLSKV